MKDEMTDADDDLGRPLGISRRRLLKLLAATGVAISVERLLPGGWITPLVMAGDDSVSAPPFPPAGCTLANFPLNLFNDSVTLVNGTSGRYQVDFLFNDTSSSLFFLNASPVPTTLITAVLMGNGSQQTIYNGATLLGQAEGGLTAFTSYGTTINCAVTPSDTPPGVIGSGYFFFETGGANVSALALLAPNSSLDWFLTWPIGRDSNVLQTQLGPTAVSLSDFLAASADDGLNVAAVAGAVALGAATVKALQGSKAEGTA